MQRDQRSIGMVNGMEWGVLVDSYLAGARRHGAHCWVDPMLDEASPEPRRGRPMSLQCSVELPATAGAAATFIVGDCLPESQQISKAHKDSRPVKDGDSKQAHLVANNADEQVVHVALDGSAIQQGVTAQARATRQDSDVLKEKAVAQGRETEAQGGMLEGLLQIEKDMPGIAQGAQHGRAHSDEALLPRAQIDKQVGNEGKGSLARTDHGLLTSDMGSLLDGLPFDLNQELDANQHYSPPTNPASKDCTDRIVHATNALDTQAHADRNILGAAEGRLNKEAKEGAAHKPMARTMTRFAVPLRKALLGTPMIRGKASAAKRFVQAENVLTERKRASKSAPKNVALSIDEQATALLMRATGVIAADEIPTDEAHQAFGETFIDSMIHKPVQDIRIALGLPGEGRVDVLGVLAAEAADSDD
ncbi:unnamed protein product [Urochloa humidicola]